MSRDDADGQTMGFRNSDEVRNFQDKSMTTPSHTELAAKSREWADIMDRNNYWSLAEHLRKSAAALESPERAQADAAAKELYAKHPTYIGTRALSWAEAPYEVREEWRAKAAAPSPDGKAEQRIPFGGFDPNFFPGSNPENPQPEPEPLMWAVHVIGPDDVYAVPDQEIADAAVCLLNWSFKRKGLDDLCRAEVIDWPHSYESWVAEKDLFRLEAAPAEASKAEQAEAPSYVPCATCGANTTSDNPNQFCSCPKAATEPPAGEQKPVETGDGTLCGHCDGSGTVTAVTGHLGPDDYEYETQCEACHGTGSSDIRDAINALSYQPHSVTPGRQMVYRGDVLRIIAARARGEQGGA